jgi:uncharacterized protein YqgC (DUF456 family)
MTWEQILGLLIALLVMCVGAGGALLPALPGAPLVLLAIILHKLYFGATGAAWWLIAISAVLTLMSLVLDYLASVYGAKKLGATRKGMIGAVVGGIVGLFFHLPGVLLGPFVGALLFEWMGGRELRDASKAGLGATLGLLAGAAGKLACCLAMMLAFTVNVIYRSAHSAGG